METLAKYLLLALLILPFRALMKQALAAKPSGLVMQVGIPVVVSCAMAFSSSFGQYPNVANLFGAAGPVWLISLLIAKGVNPALPWKTLWTTVPIMSWYTVNVSMCFYYPAQGGGGGLGLWMGWLLGWLYLVIPFALLQGAFVGGRWAHRINR